MAIRFRCPQCSKEYEVADEYAGRQAKCQSCGAAIAIPSAVAPAPPAAAPGGQSVYAQPPAAQSVYAQTPADRGLYAQPPGQGLVPPLPVKRPASVTVVAILQIIFNSLALVGVLLTVVQLAGGWHATRGSEAVEADSVGRTWMFIKLPISAVVGVLWIVVCVGLLRLRRWARSTALGLIILDLVVGVVGVGMAIRASMSAEVAKLIEEQPQAVRQAMSVALVVAIIFAVLVVAYYVLVLILLTRRKVAAAFDAAARQPRPPGR